MSSIHHLIQNLFWKRDDLPPWQITFKNYYFVVLFILIKNLEASSCNYIVTKCKIFSILILVLLKITL